MITAGVFAADDVRVRSGRGPVVDGRTTGGRDARARVGRRATVRRPGRRCLDPAAPRGQRRAARTAPGRHRRRPPAPRHGHIDRRACHPTPAVSVM